MAIKPESPTCCTIRMVRPQRPGPRSRCHHGVFLLLLGHKRQTKLVGQPGARAGVALHISRSSRCSLSRLVMPVSWKAALQRRAPKLEPVSRCHPAAIGTFAAILLFDLPLEACKYANI